MSSIIRKLIKKDRSWRESLILPPDNDLGENFEIEEGKEVNTNVGIVKVEDVQEINITPKTSETMKQMVMSTDSELKRINKAVDKIEILPSNQSKKDIETYVNRMVELKKPRLIREYGRPSKDIEEYAIPTNYFPVESNLVPFNLNQGFYNPFGSDVAVKEVNTLIMGKEIKLFNANISNDLGTILCHYLFNHGRKTIDELQKELGSYDPTLLTILVNKLKNDGFIQIWDETGEYYYNDELVETKEEEKGLKTLELVTKQVWYENSPLALEQKKIDEEKKDKENEEL